MFIPITFAKDDSLRCTSCGSVAVFYNDEDAIFYCEACATVLAEELLSVLMTCYLMTAPMTTSRPQ